jgi:hypothetical protein
MARGQTTKRLARAHVAFKQAVTAYIVSKGARRVDEFYDYEIDTPAGPLGISVWDDAIMARFADLDRGKSFTSTVGLPCNPFSGKWNFRYIRDFNAQSHYRYR